MNDKILIVEDRLERQIQRLGKERADALRKTVKVETGLPGLTDKDNYDFHNLDGFDLVAIHRSYFNGTQLARFNAYVDHSKSYFIIFSGGISQVSILKKGHLANLPIQRFYTPDIIDRLYSFDKGNQPLAHFLYGENWKLPFLQRLRLLQWLGLDDEDGDIPEVVELKALLGNVDKIGNQIHEIYLKY
jgi:hypothetical protein